MELSVGMPGAQVSGNTFPAREEPQVTPKTGPDREPHGSDSRRPVAGAVGHADCWPGSEGGLRARAEHPSTVRTAPPRISRPHTNELTTPDSRSVLSNPRIGQSIDAKALVMGLWVRRNGRYSAVSEESSESLVRVSVLRVEASAECRQFRLGPLGAGFGGAFGGCFAVGAGGFVCGAGFGGGSGLGVVVVGG